MPYRVCWRSPVNGEVQRDRPLYPSMKAAQEMSRLMNEVWPDTRHWAEPADDWIVTSPADAFVGIRN
jgi:hypothetical protein